MRYAKDEECVVRADRQLTKSSDHSPHGPTRRLLRSTSVSNPNSSIRATLLPARTRAVRTSRYQSAPVALELLPTRTSAVRTRHQIELQVRRAGNILPIIAVT